MSSMSMPNTVQGWLRIATMLTAALLSCFAIATFLAETFAPKPPRFPRDPASQTVGNASSPFAEWIAGVAPLRGDLLSAVAFARAARLAQAGKASASSDLSTDRESTISLAKQSLSLAPYSSSTWLLLASLQAQASDRAAAAEALKMSYLTASADFDIIPARLGVFATVATKADDLSDLARGDIRLILTYRSDLKAAISEAYAKGSPEGKELTYELVYSQDPTLAATLR
ncbi:MAG: hypothetical protein JWP25_7500 [Bradyrhizobium sp.]|nr:hypothetical protein [Bradyrhizobium sp.]